MQDVWTDLGRPCGIHQKQVHPSCSVIHELVRLKYSGSCLSCHHRGEILEIEFCLSQVDQMVIHSASDPRPRTTICGDYFYNYFTCGVDILFDGQVSNFRLFYSSTVKWPCIIFDFYSVRHLLICRHTKLRSLFSIPTILGMQILTHTWNAISLSTVLIVSCLLLAPSYKSC